MPWGLHNIGVPNRRYGQNFDYGLNSSVIKFELFIQQQPLQHQGLILALLTGDKSLLDSETEAQFQRFGISHLLAISGPHALIFAGMFCWALHQLIRCYRPHWYLWMPKQYLLMLPFLSCVLLYTAFVGFEIPALRTLLMCSLVTAMLVMKQKLTRFCLTYL